MKRVWLLVVACLALATFGRAEEEGAAPADDANRQLIEHGSYLVNRVAMCVQCHSPRNKKGAIRERDKLTGAVMPLQSPFHYQLWALNAPPLRGLPTGYSEEALVTLLTQGIGRTGVSPRHPMPPFRFTEADARAVVAYLKWTGTQGVVKDVSQPEHPALPLAIATLRPTEGSNVHGLVGFTEENGQVHITADVTGLTPGLHGFHIHEHGDCSAPDASSAGGHFNPYDQPHGRPDSGAAHAGDLGNLVADENGRAHYERVDHQLKLRGENGIIGRSVIVHGGMDDLKSQPSGASGPRVACGVVEWEK